MKRAYGGMMSTEHGGHNCLLIIGGVGPPPSTQIPQAQYFQLHSAKVSTNEHNMFDILTGKNINVSYYQISLITVTATICNYCIFIKVCIS